MQPLTHSWQPDEIPCPTIHDTILVKLPRWLYTSTIGRVIALKPTKHKQTAQDNSHSISSSSRAEPAAPAILKYEAPTVDDESDAAQYTPVSDSADEFELLDKPSDSMYKTSKTSGSQPLGSKSSRRRGKKK